MRMVAKWVFRRAWVALAVLLAACGPAQARQACVHFAEQAMYCEMFGSPFTAQLIKCMSEDYERGGPVATLLKDWSTNPRADALALRIAGYFHAAVLANRDAELGAHYPSQLAN